MPMPPADPLSGGGPCTPSPFEIKSLAYGRSRHLPLPTSVSNGSVASDCSTSTVTSEHSASSAASEDPQTPASAMAGLALSSCDVTPLSSPLVSPPSVTVTGKRHREEWTMDEVQLLESALARPPPDLHFPPGSMPPPDVLDGLTNAVFETVCGGAEWSAVFSSATSSAIPIGNLDIDFSSIQVWPHSWDETRHKFAAIALADTRLGAELANRKLTRQERLARPGIKRVGSMDYLDDEEVQAMPSERIGRVLRLSTMLQQSARGVEPVRAPSLGSSLGSGSASSSTTLVRAPSLGSTRSTSLRAGSAEAQPIPSPLPRTSSSLSVSSAGSMSRRPSLLVRGRSFTASELEAEGEESDQDVDVAMGEFSFGVGTVVDAPDEISPRTPTVAVLEPPPIPVVAAAENTPAVAVSGPSPPEALETVRSPPHKRRQPVALLGRSKSYGPSERDAHMQRDSFLAPPMPHAPKVLAMEAAASGRPSPAPSMGGDLQGAFEWSAPGTSKVPGGWESEDSDREGMAMKKPRRKMRGTLAMTALNAAAGKSDSGASSCSSSSPRSRSASLSNSDGGSGASTPPLVISAMVDEAALIGEGGLRSPFEERQLELP